MSATRTATEDPEPPKRRRRTGWRRARIAIVLLTIECPPLAAAGLPALPIQALAVDPTNSQVVYAGSTAGVYKTVDGGSNWTRVDSGLPYSNVQALAIHPQAPCTIYAGIDSGLMNTFVPPNTIIVNNTTGILAVSTNCGATWGVASNAPSGRSTRSLAFTSGNPAALYASITVNAVSAGASVTQHRIARMLPGFTDFSFTFDDFNYVVATGPAGPCIAYAGALSGTVRRNSTCGPGAMVWSTVGSPLTSGGKPTQVNAIAVHPANPAALLAGTGAGVIYKKDDDASPWNPAATVAGSINSIVFEPGNAQVAYAAGSAGVVYTSADGGGSWAPLSTVASGVSALAAGGSPQLRVYAAGNTFVATVVPGQPVPGVVTMSAVGITGTSATLSATVNPNGSATSARFDWGPTASFGSQIDAVPSPGSGTSPVAVTAMLAGLTCSTLYHFRAVATNAGGTATGSSLTFVTSAAGCPFTDDPLTPRMTLIKAIHISELRQRIDLLRARYQLPAFGWTDPVLQTGVTAVRAQHIAELRTALAEAYTAAGRPLPIYTDPGVGAGSTTASAHVTELRAAVVALE